MSEATFLSLSSGDTYIEASNNFDPDAESDIEDILFEGSADMGNSGKIFKHHFVLTEMRFINAII